MLHPTVFNTSTLARAYGIKHIVLSPGSRNAPLTLSFARNPAIKKWVVPDERAAAFIALGIAQHEKEPVGICCTSGSAVLNYYPAIAEAYYREIPLMIFSADRPPELIDQRDGQTIRQFEVLDKHLIASYQLPVIATEEDATSYRTLLTEALQKLSAPRKGPVHLNIPFKEPFYPAEDQELKFWNIESKIKLQEPEVIEHKAGISERALSTIDRLQSQHHALKVLILVGQRDFDPGMNQELETISKSIPILKSPLNNIRIEAINHVDLLISSLNSEARPDLLITAGLSVLSKQLKRFLRNHTPSIHLHFDPAGVEVDTYDSNPELIAAPLLSFLPYLRKLELSKAYLDYWKDRSTIAKEAIAEFTDPQKQFSELACFKYVLDALPNTLTLHVSNSMPVRYLDLFGIKDTVECFCNRGTSGIDGCTSTALGHALTSPNLNLLMTGDLAFLYDRNAFFHNHSYDHLRIVVFNNQGGGIFRLIEGPSRQPELETFFETRHKRTAEYICLENNIEYHAIKDWQDLDQALEVFFTPGHRCQLMEIFTDPIENQQSFRAFKTYINEQLQHRLDNG